MASSADNQSLQLNSVASHIDQIDELVNFLENIKEKTNTRVSGSPPNPSHLQDDAAGVPCWICPPRSDMGGSNSTVYVNNSGHDVNDQKNLYQKNDQKKHFAQAEKLQRDLCNVKRDLSNFKKLDDVVADVVGSSRNRIGQRIVPEDEAGLEGKFRLLAEMVQNLKGQVKAAEEPFALTFEPYYLVRNEKNEGTGMKNRIENASYYRDYLCNDLEGMFKDLEAKYQSCLMYFSVFPENAVLRKSFLKNWWIGEKLFNNTTEGRGEVDEVLKLLLKKGFIKPFLKKRMLVGFQVDPLIRFVLIKIAGEKGFFSFDSLGVPSNGISENGKAFLVKCGDDYSRIALMQVIENQKLGKLKTLFNVNDSYPDFKEDWFSKLRNLEVLSLGGLHGSFGPDIQDGDSKLNGAENIKNLKFKGPRGTRGLLRQHIEVEDAYFLKGMKNMKKLKFLGLQGISRLMMLPESIGNLSALEILDLCACHNLESFPKGLAKLKNLTHLDLSECYLLDLIPKGVASLSKLQVLKGFLIGSSSSTSTDSCTLTDLKSLTELRKLSIYTNNQKFPGEKDLAVLKGFKSLQNLAIVWGGKFWKHEEKVRKGKSEEIPDEARSSKESNSDRDLTRASIPQVKGDNRMDKIPEDDEIVSSKPSGNPVSQPVLAEQKNNAKHLQRFLSRKSSERMQNVDNNTKKSGNTGSDEPTREAQIEEITYNGIRKLELQCYPGTDMPSWVFKGQLKPQKKLYIGGGNLRSLGDINPVWKISILRLKFLSELELDWTELRKSFPDLVYLEKVRCPKLSLFPCDNTGVWWKRDVEEKDLLSLGLPWSFLKYETH